MVLLGRECQQSLSKMEETLPMRTIWLEQQLSVMGHLDCSTRKYTCVGETPACQGQSIIHGVTNWRLCMSAAATVTSNLLKSSQQLGRSPLNGGTIERKVTNTCSSPETVKWNCCRFRRPEKRLNEVLSRASLNWPLLLKWVAVGRCTFGPRQLINDTLQCHWVSPFWLANWYAGPCASHQYQSTRFSPLAVRQTRDRFFLSLSLWYRNGDPRVHTTCCDNWASEQYVPSQWTRVLLAGRQYGGRKRERVATWMPEQHTK